MRGLVSHPTNSASFLQASNADQTPYCGTVEWLEAPSCSFVSQLLVADAQRPGCLPRCRGGLHLQADQQPRRGQQGQLGATQQPCRPGHRPRPISTPGSGERTRSNVSGLGESAGATPPCGTRLLASSSLAAPPSNSNSLPQVAGTSGQLTFSFGHGKSGRMLPS